MVHKIRCKVSINLLMHSTRAFSLDKMTETTSSNDNSKTGQKLIQANIKYTWSLVIPRRLSDYLYCWWECWKVQHLKDIVSKKEILSCSKSMFQGSLKNMLSTNYSKNNWFDSQVMDLCETAKDVRINAVRNNYVVEQDCCSVTSSYSTFLLVNW